VGEATSDPYYDRYTPEEYAKRLSSANGYNNRTNIHSYVMDNILNYKKELGDHYIDFTAVATHDYYYYKQVSATGSDYELNGNTILGVDGIHKATIQKVDLNVVEKANIGYVGRLSYAYNDKYHFTATMRRDGASVFGADKKWGNFPSVGLAWTATQEDFMSSFDKLSYLKLKVSYGKNGNQGLSAYQTLASVTSGSDGGIRYEFGDAPSTILYGVEQDNLGSSTLGWETTTAFNGGFQSAWLNNRISLDLDFYFSKTTDQIFSRNIPIMTGFGSIYSSLGQVDNKGIEISLNTVNIDNADFKWSSRLLFWQNRNKIASLYGEDLDGDGVEDDDISNSLFVGKPLNAIYGYEYIGVVQEDDTEYLANVGGAAGDPMFKDISGPDGEPDGVITADYDRKILGYSSANYKISLSNTVQYKNFSLYVMLTGIFGGGKDNYFLTANKYHNSFQSEYQYNEIDHDWWTSENKSEKYLRANAYSTRYLGLQSRTFVKVQDINLSYRLPKGMLSGIGVKSLQVYSSVKNAYTFTNWFGGGDPEKGITPQSGTNPVPTTFLMGLKVSF
jgi:TonB-linked SusC/RagA family outer membrane protein